MKTTAALLLGIILFSIQASHGEGEVTHAQTLDNTKIYTVEHGDCLLEIGIKFGVSEQALKKVNNKNSGGVVPGEKLIIPESISAHEEELLARLVHAEAKGEPYAGKVAVAEVVLNRVESEEFPDTIKKVIFQERQFEPVSNGMINGEADRQAFQAVKEALAKEGRDSDTLFFFNPDQTDSKWLRTRTVTKEIGNHRFAK